MYRPTVCPAFYKTDAVFKATEPFPLVPVM